MNDSENYRNYGLEELIRYVNSELEVQTDVSCDNSLTQITPANQKENYQNWALVELMNYVKSIAEIQSDIGCENSQNQSSSIQNKLVEVEVTVLATDIAQQTNGDVSFSQNEEITLSPSNVTNLMTVIQDLHVANGNLVKRVTGLSQAIADFHQELENSQAQLYTASSKLGEQSQELETNYQTIQAQQSSIEKLKSELAIANQLVVQVQADYNEQFDRLAAEKDSCRDLRTRLNREQQHSLQLKVALEKCLEVPTSSYQLTDNYSEDATCFTSKAPPIEPWTTQTRGGNNPIDLSWEQQNYSSQTNAEAVEEDLESLDSVIVEESLKAITLIATDEVQAASPITTQFNNQVKSPSPLVYPSRPPKGRKSLASIDLPRFVS